jgi:hypothetical protein
MLEIYEEDIILVLKEDFNYIANDKEAKYIIENILDNTEGDHVIEDEPYCLEGQYTLLKARISNKIEDNKEEISFIRSIELIKKLEGF